MLPSGFLETLFSTAVGMVVIDMPTSAFYNPFVSCVTKIVIEVEQIPFRMESVLKRH